MIRSLSIVALVASLAGSAAVAQSDFSGQLKARQGQFRILAINLGILGGMAKGEIEYNAEAAQAAADSLVGVSMVNQPPLWPEGSDADSIEGTRAKATIWSERADFLDKFAALGPAALNMQSVAATGQEAIGPAMGQLGGACKACHDAHRTPQN